MSSKIPKKALKTKQFFTVTTLSKVKIEKVVAPNKFQVGLDDADFKQGMSVYGGVVLNKDSAPADTANRLYNDNGTLKFNGEEIKGGGGTSGNAGWLSGSQIIWTTGSVGIHTHSPDRFLEINHEKYQFDSYFLQF